MSRRSWSQSHGVFVGATASPLRPCAQALRASTSARARLVSSVVLAAVALLAWGPERAHAAGVEDTVTGGVALGRSAGYVRANDFMAVWQNPANLALVPGKDVGLELRLPVFNGCFARTPDPELVAKGGYLATESFDKSCNSAGPLPAGNIGFALPLPRNFGFGVGLFTPGGVPKLKFGNNDVNAIALNPAAETLPISAGKRESPGRYLLVDKNVLAAFLMVGAGWAPIRQLRVGLSVGAGVVSVDYSNVTSLIAGLFTDQEFSSHVQVADSFVPRATVSVAATPLDAIDLLASFTWNDDVSAKGNLDVVANGFNNAPRGDCGSATPGPHCRAKDVTLKIPYQRYEVLLGARYAQRKKPRERALQPMKDEVFDVEVNALWSQTSHVDNFTLKINEGRAVTQRVALTTDPTAVPQALPQNATLFHGWRDTYGVRLGGDYNVLPALLAVRAGVAYESSGVPAKNMNIDYWPIQKYTLSLGATVALDRFKLTLAYAHVFYQTVTTRVGEGNVKEITAIPGATPDAAQAVNEGKYTASLNVVSLQANYTF
jgi:long-subunit fatty acid transport protein